jgi:hypothetical protein
MSSAADVEPASFAADDHRSCGCRSLTAIEDYLHGLIELAQAVVPGSARVLASVGHERNALLMLTVEAEFGREEDDAPRRPALPVRPGRQDQGGTDRLLRSAELTRAPGRGAWGAQTRSLRECVRSGPPVSVHGVRRGRWQPTVSLWAFRRHPSQGSSSWRRTGERVVLASEEERWPRGRCSCPT